MAVEGAPIVTCPNNTFINVDVGNTDANVTWLPLPTAKDNNDTVIDVANITCEDSLGNVVMSGDLYPVGTTTVTCRANDTALNEGSCEFNITVVGRYFVLLMSILVLVVIFVI